MDDQPAAESGATVPDLAAQLLAYADALEATRATRPSSDPALHDPGRPGRSQADIGRWRALSVAAALALLGGTVWWWSDRDDGSVSATDPATDTDPAVTLPAGAEPFLLLPDLDRWALTDHYEQTVESSEQIGIWVWRLDGHLVLLSEGVVVDDAPPSREEASAVVDGDRVMLRWAEDGTGYDLQGLGVDEAGLRTALTSLARVDGGWQLPGADLVTADGPGPRPAGGALQITISPRGDGGVPVPSRRVDIVIRTGTEADLYRDLHEAGSMGPVTDTSIAGAPGFAIRTTDDVYATAAIGGSVVTVTTSDTDLDLDDLLGSLQPVAADAWADAVATIEANRAEVAAAGGIDPIEIPEGQLPRYRLPDPWAFTLVTDTGVWTPEERAQRQALDEAQLEAQNGGRLEQVLVQGFRTAPSEPDAPIELPDVLITIWAFDGEIRPDELVDDELEPVTVAGMDGFLYPDGYFPGGEGAGLRLYGDHVGVELTTAGLSAAQLRAFIAGLSLRGDDAGSGFDPGHDVGTVFELDGSELPRGVDDGTEWHASFENRSGGRRVGVSVSRLTASQLQMELASYYGQIVDLPTNLSGIDGGRYLAITGVGGRTVVLRYDTAAGLLTEVTVDGTADEGVELLEQLVEVDLDEWRTLVEPFNAKPLEPR